MNLDKQEQTASISFIVESEYVLFLLKFIAIKEQAISKNVELVLLKSIV